MCHNLQPRFIPFSHCRVIFLRILTVLLLILHQKPVDHHILRRIEQDTLCPLSVPSGPSGLLIIILQTLRHIIVDHITHIRLIDPHAKSVGRHHHRTLIIDKIILAAFAFHARKSGMVLRHRHTFAAQFLIEGIYIFPGRTVDDTALRLMFPHIIHDIAVLMPDRLHCKVEIPAVKSCHQYLRCLKAEHTCNVLLDVFRRRCRKGTDDRALPKSLYKLYDL